LGGKVLTALNAEQWVTVASTTVDKNRKLSLQARAHLLEPDVAEVETRVVGDAQQSANFIVRLGEQADMSVNQMEGATAPAGQQPPTNLKVKVRKVRYAL
jgi:hypothetical protein